MKVCVVSPYLSEPRHYLEQCRASVEAQTFPVVHYWVADGNADPDVAGWKGRHLTLGQAHRDGGAIARGLGGLCAAFEGADAVAFLDSDNWYRADHIRHMVELQQQTGSDVCISGMAVCRPDGSLMIENDPSNDGDEHADTSVMFITRPAFGSLALWAAMPRELGPIGDRVYWWYLKRHYSIAVDLVPTLYFRTLYRGHFEIAKEPVPPGAKYTGPLLGWWHNLIGPKRDALCDDLLGTAGFGPHRDPDPLTTSGFPAELRVS